MARPSQHRWSRSLPTGVGGVGCGDVGARCGEVSVVQCGAVRRSGVLLECGAARSVRCGVVGCWVRCGAVCGGWRWFGAGSRGALWPAPEVGRVNRGGESKYQILVALLRSPGKGVVGAKHKFVGCQTPDTIFDLAVT
jgi:hypothetical protein